MRFAPIGGIPHSHAHCRGKNKHSPTYISWLRMRQRCQCLTAHNFKHYGGRGIRLCERWQAFANFLTDMGERPAGMSIERLNNDGNYEPGNCVWADQKTQMQNTRGVRLLTYAGRTQTLQAWATEIGVTRQTLRKRLLKMNFSAAITRTKHPSYAHPAKHER